MGQSYSLGTTTFHASTKITPFQTVPPISYGHKKTPNNEVETMLKEGDLALSALIIQSRIE